MKPALDGLIRQLEGCVHNDAQNIGFDDDVGSALDDLAADEEGPFWRLLDNDEDASGWGWMYEDEEGDPGRHSDGNSDGNAGTLRSGSPISSQPDVAVLNLPPPTQVVAFPADEYLWAASVAVYFLIAFFAFLVLTSVCS